MSRLFFTILTIAVLGFACTNDDTKSSINNPSTPVLIQSPDLKVQAVNGECLDLEAIVRQTEDPAFQFPGFAYTRNFEILGSSGGLEFTRTLVARSFRADVARINGFADLAALKQEGCDRVVMPDAGQLPLTYKITDFSQTHLQLELDTEALKEPMASLSDTHQEAIREFPAVTKILIRVINPTRVQVISNYRSVEMECPKVKSQEVREDRIYNWVARDATPDSSVDLDPVYSRQLLELAPGFTLRNQRTMQDRVHLEPQEAQDLLTALQARTYAPCN